MQLFFNENCPWRLSSPAQPIRQQIVRGMYVIISMYFYKYTENVGYFMLLETYKNVTVDCGNDVLQMVLPLRHILQSS